MVIIELSLPGEKKKRRENIMILVEDEISLTLYTSATSTVLDCCTNIQEKIREMKFKIIKTFIYYH